MNKTAHWLNPNWKYVPSNRTDVRKTIERERRRLKEEADKKQTATVHKLGRA